MFARAGLFALAALLLCGCGGGESAPTDAAAYEQAVSAYLEKESMGMKVAGFESLEKNGDNATAFVRLQDAEGLTGVKVKWEFNFRKSGDGWTVTSAREAR